MTEFDNGYSEYAKQRHKERVAQTPERIRYAIQIFEQYGIRYELKDEERGHFHVWRQRDGKLFNFYAGTGKIAGYDRVRGIHTLVRMMMPGDRAYVRAVMVRRE